jgi:hypothetical protein
MPLVFYLVCLYYCVGLANYVKAVHHEHQTHHQQQQQNGPMFILEPPSKIHFSNTSGAVIGCSATGFPSVRISWVLADGSQVIDVNSLRYVRSNGELVFPPFPSAQYRQDIHSTVCTLSFDLHCI